MKATWKALRPCSALPQCEFQWCLSNTSRGPSCERCNGDRICSGRPQHLDTAVLHLCYIWGHYWIRTCSPVAVVLSQAWYCPRVWLRELIFRPVTPHLDGEPQQFTKQTVPVWESTAAAASNAMNTINKPCCSFPTVLENWDPMPARDGVSEKIIL